MVLFQKLAKLKLYDKMITKKWHDPANLIYYSLLTFAATLPLTPVLFNNIAAVLLLLSWLYAASMGALLKPRYKGLLYLFIAFFLIHLLGLFYSENTKEAFSQLEKKALLLIMPVILSTCPILSVNRVKSIFLLFAVVSTFISILCIAVTFYTNLSNGIALEAYNAWLYSSENLVKHLGFHPNYMAIYSIFCIMMFAMLLVHTLRQRRTFIAMTYILAVLFHIGFIALLSARMQIIIFFTLALVAILYYTLKYKKLLRGLATMTALMLIITASIAYSPILKEKFKGLFGVSITSDGQKFSSNLRIQKWSSALNVFKANLIWGTGTGDIQDELQKEYKKSGYIVPYQERYNAHNQYLDIAGRFGIIGLAIFLTSLVFPFIKAIKHSIMLYIGFLLLIVLSFIPEVVLSLNKGVAFYAFINSIFAFHCFGRKSTSQVFE